MTTFFKKAKIYIRKYWRILLVVLVAAISFIFFKSSNLQLSKMIENIRKSHDEEIEKIDSERLNERKRIEENKKKLEQNLDSIQKDFDKSRNDLERQKQDNIKVILNDSKGDPEKLADDVSDAFGFEIIKPKG